MRGELDRVAARTGLPAVDVRRCLFHSDAYRAKVAAATATDEEALIDEMMPGRRAIEDVFDETFALSQAIEERLDEIKAAAAAGTLLRPEDKAVDETKDTSAFAQADENPMDGELEYVTGKTGMPLAAVRRCLVESALCRIDHKVVIAGGVYLQNAPTASSCSWESRAANLRRLNVTLR